jgi:DNA polymerase III gamma/tau subunit
MADATQWSDKYRPKIIEEFCGQPAAIAVIKGWTKANKIPSAIGFFGPSGCGKTTLARLSAALFTGGSSNPRKNSDIHDVPPNERSIAEVRDLIQLSRHSPRGGKRRCIILNEGHNYLADAQKALLAAIEEPYPKTTWMICTDQPERLIPQLAMRVQPITLGVVPDTDITELLEWILKSERRNFGNNQTAIIKRVVEASYGVPRQAVQLLDLVNSALMGGGSASEAIKMAVKSASVSDAFDSSLKFIRAMLQNNTSDAVRALNLAGNCDGMLHLMLKMLNAMAYVANGGKPKPGDGLGWAVVKALGNPQDLDRVLALQVRMCMAMDVLTRSNYQVPAESLLLAMARKS